MGYDSADAKDQLDDSNDSVFFGLFNTQEDTNSCENEYAFLEKLNSQDQENEEKVLLPEDTFLDSDAKEECKKLSKNSLLKTSKQKGKRKLFGKRNYFDSSDDQEEVLQLQISRNKRFKFGRKMFSKDLTEQHDGDKVQKAMCTDFKLQYCNDSDSSD